MRFLPNIQHASISHSEMQVELKDALTDIQGIISRGYETLNSAQYLLLRINDAQKAKGYFGTLRPFITNACKETYITDGISNDPIEAVQIAFTKSGLKNLGIPDDVLQTFSREFYEGMAPFYEGETRQLINHRSLILGDTGPNDAKHWLWGNVEKRVDCIIMLFAKDNRSLKNLVKKYYDDIQDGVTLVYPGDTIEYSSDTSKEHFGFDDGISQPIIKGFTKANGVADKNLLNTGEFILGYLNEYNKHSPTPSVVSNKAPEVEALEFLPTSFMYKNLGKNGTYMVHRQIFQDVELFWKYAFENSREIGVTPEKRAINLAAKMVGRMPEGEPLVKDETKENINNFDFRDDQDGLQCPFGSHIRRTNPRSNVRHINDERTSIEMVRKHAMLRRARSFGAPLADFKVEKMIEIASKSDAKATKYDENNYIPRSKRGLHFFCLVSDISRQFEFVQSVWSNTETFAQLCHEVDPITAPRPTDGQPNCVDFTVPACPVRRRYENMPQFTNVIGGAYYFLPGLKALDYIISKL